jgi:hypothetical protein
LRLLAHGCEQFFRVAGARVAAALNVDDHLGRRFLDQLQGFVLRVVHGILNERPRLRDQQQHRIPLVDQELYEIVDRFHRRDDGANRAEEPGRQAGWDDD